MVDLLQTLLKGTSNLLGALPDFVWTAFAASIPVVLGAHFAVRKIAQERRHDAKVSSAIVPPEPRLALRHHL